MVISHQKEDSTISITSFLKKLVIKIIYGKQFLDPTFLFPPNQNNMCLYENSVYPKKLKCIDSVQKQKAQSITGFSLRKVNEQ